jgi:hypothetical protein
MFRDAYERACRFTEPVIDFCLTVEGECSAGLSALVIVNPDGWIVTAAHVVQSAAALAKADSDARAWETKRDAIKADTSLSAKERSRQLSGLGQPKKKFPRRAATRWGHHGSRLRDIKLVPEVDLAVGRLDPFDPKWVAEYPVFKDPSKDFRRGASLCKLGFPFYRIKPTFDEATQRFDIPPEMMTIPFFPIEGIFTRGLLVPPPDPAPPYPLMFVETSSPGLRGQSGGPTFDQNGVIWAIQSRTRHFPLEFSPEVKERGQTHKEHQFLNVGEGIHVETILGVFNELGIAHTMSDY